MSRHLVATQLQILKLHLQPLLWSLSSGAADSGRTTERCGFVSSEPDSNGLSESAVGICHRANAHEQRDSVGTTNP
jgi:hypothetical protein